MHRRARHLNPKHAGAVRAYDSRFVSGTDNIGLQTWPDRCANANATQGTGANQALYIARGQGGNPVIRFDGSNDYFLFTELDTANGITAIGTHKVSNDGVLFGGSGGDNLNCQIIRLYTSKSLWYNTSLTFPNTTIYLSANTGDWSTFGVASVGAFSGQPLKSARNGVNMGNSSTNVTTAGSKFKELGSVFSGAATVNGDVGQAIIILSNIFNTPVLKRLEHAAAFSFKFACS